MLAIPETLGLFDALLLVATSFFTSFLTAAMGLGGGVVLLAVMAQLMPVSALIPVHGIVQLGSNAGRMILMRSHINLRLVGVFLLGSLIGGFVGGRVVVAVPVPLLQLMLGAFILYAAWGRMFVLGADRKGMGVVFIGGLGATLLTMFVGATGPFVAALLKPFGLDRMVQVGTMAACMVVQHLVKVVAFGLLGFAFAPYIPLMAVMILFGFMGTAAGKRLLHRSSDARFRLALNIVLTLLAIRLFYSALV